MWKKYFIFCIVNLFASWILALATGWGNSVSMYGRTDSVSI